MAGAIAIAASSSCGYPDYAFVPDDGGGVGAGDDTSIGEVSIDSGRRDSTGDVLDETLDETSDSAIDSTIDSTLDSSMDSSTLDSIADSRPTDSKVDSTPLDGGPDARDADAGSTCGAANFTVHCSDGVTDCPTNSHCVDDYFCTCEPSYVAKDCTGKACSPTVACNYPNWSCTGVGVSACGASNFTTPCPGGGFCPSHSSCVKSGVVCACDSGFVGSTCSGTSCDTVTCGYPDWWCHK